SSDSTMANLCPGLLWALIWFLALIFLAWPVSYIIAFVYILLLPFSACVGLLKPVCDTLLGVVNLCLTCAENMIAMKPLC
ncbi:hypothetical protein BOX15_Mlig014448g1, partial [Macrostomum lignano]